MDNYNQLTIDYLNKNSSAHDNASASPFVGEIIPRSECVLEHAHIIPSMSFSFSSIHHVNVVFPSIRE